MYKKKNKEFREQQLNISFFLSISVFFFRFSILLLLSLQSHSLRFFYSHHSHNNACLNLSKLTLKFHGAGSNFQEIVSSSNS